MLIRSGIITLLPFWQQATWDVLSLTLQAYLFIQIPSLILPTAPPIPALCLTSSSIPQVLRLPAVLSQVPSGISTASPQVHLLILRLHFQVPATTRFHRSP